MPRPRKPYNPAQLGQPNRQRHAKPGEGFHEENLAPHGAPPVIRAVERAPLTPPEAGKRVTALDKAIQDAEALALFRSFVGSMVADGKMRIGGDDGKVPMFIKSDPTNRLPFNEKERLEIGAFRFVYSKLPEESQIDLDIFIQQLMPRDFNKREEQFYIGPVSQGKIIANTTCERKAMGAYIGNYRKLAQHINFLYVEWEMNQFRERQRKKALRKERESLPQELSTGLMKKVLA